jgi:membrane protein
MVAIGDPRELRRHRPAPLWNALIAGLVVAAGLGRNKARADDVTELKREEAAPKQTWKDFFVRLFNQVYEDRVLANAAGVTFYALLAVFPAIVALVSIYGLFADPARISLHLEQLAGILPEGALQIIGEQLQRISSAGTGNLSIAFIGSLLIALWSATGGTKALFDALNVAYGEEEKRGFIRFNAISLGFTLGFICFVLLVLAGVVVVPAVLNFLPLPDATSALVQLLPFPVLLIVAGFIFGLIYRYGPSHSGERGRWITPGSIFAAVAWLAGSAAFSWYAANFGNFNETYGSLGAAVGFMFWIWISTIVVLIGGEINAEWAAWRKTGQKAHSRKG